MADRPDPTDDATPGEGPDRSDDPDDASGDELPEDVVAEAERLTRLARRAVDEDEAEAYRERRAAILDEYGFTDRIREGEHGDVLVCYPAEWVEDGTVDVDAVEDVSRGVEVPLDGPGDPDEWERVYERNRDLADRVRSEYGEVHGDNAAALAEYASNHYAKPIEALSGDAVEAFREDYYPRNVWPTDEQAAALDESIDRVYELASTPRPDAPERE